MVNDGRIFNLFLRYNIDMNRVPLAERMRPTTLSEVMGQEAIIGDGKILTEIVKKGEPVNLIFWGPPGTGKTTLARILAHEFKADFVEISAVTAGKKDVEAVVERAKVNWNLKTRTGVRLPPGVYTYYAKYNDGTVYGGTSIGKIIIAEDNKVQ